MNILRKLAAGKIRRIKVKNARARIDKKSEEIRNDFDRMDRIDMDSFLPQRYQDTNKRIRHGWTQIEK